MAHDDDLMRTDKALDSIARTFRDHLLEYVNRFGSMPDDDMVWMICEQAFVRHVIPRKRDIVSAVIRLARTEDEAQYVLADSCYHLRLKWHQEFDHAIRMLYSFSTGIPVKDVPDSTVEWYSRAKGFPSGSRYSQAGTSDV